MIYQFKGNPNGQFYANQGDTGFDTLTGNPSQGIPQNNFICSGGSIWAANNASGTPSGPWGGLVIPSQPATFPEPAGYVSPAYRKDWMTWGAFQSLVLTQLPWDANRIGASENFVPQQIRNGAIDLIDYVPRYRTGREDVYYETDFTTDGMASVGALPPGSTPREFWVTDLGLLSKHRARPYDWNSRFDLVHGRIIHNNFQPLLAISPQSDRFYIYPRICGRKVLSVFYDSFRLDFSDNDLVPMEEDAAQAVADYVRAKTLLHIEHNAPESELYMKHYALKRRNLFLRQRSN
jgi:hypothetical protein